jgi:transcriptional activator SPT8
MSCYWKHHGGGRIRKWQQYVLLQTITMNSQTNCDTGSAEEEDEQEEGDAMDVDDEEEGDDQDDGDNDDEDGDGDGDNDDDDQDQDEPDSPSQRPRSSLPNGGTPGPSDANPAVTLTSPSPRAASASGILGNLPFRPSVRQEALNAPVYDIIPTIAAPHSTSINAVTATPDMRWVFSGGADGYIRKFNWVDTANGKLALTVAQRHPFVDSVTKAGVLLSYWENEDASGTSDSLSPVYSLAVHHQSLWLLSGLESGGINLQSVRHQEGQRIHTLKGHTSAVSVLTLAADELSVLSGSWDKTINDWDLNTGQVKRKFETSGGQISAIEQRPMSTLPIPQDTETVPSANGTFSSNNAARPRANGSVANGTDSAPAGAAKEEGTADAQGSPEDSLFGDKDSLFGDGQDNNPSSALPAFGDDDDEFSRAIATGIQQADEDGQGDMDIMDTGGPVQTPEEPAADTETLKEPPAPAPEATVNGTTDLHSTATVNGLPHAEDTEKPAPSSIGQAEQPISSETTFFDASMDGTLRIWDRRQSNPVARISPPRNTPPWCMNACWSPDGNFIYAGRRNGSIDEYSLHKGLREPRRTFKFPNVSGPVSAVRTMPNGKHLLW